MQTEMDIDQHVGSSLLNYDIQKEKTKMIDTIILKNKIKMDTIERIKEVDSEIRISSSQGDSDDPSNPKSDEKDKYGASRSLRKQIIKKYEFIEILGKGSYGCVSKAKCLKTGRIVALKIMENQTNTEYDTIKLLREIMLMKKLQQLCAQISQVELGTKTCNIFTPELIDIICPLTIQLKKDLARVTPSSMSTNTNSSLAKKGKHKSDFNVHSNGQRLDLSQMDFSHLKSICLVMEFVETDLD